MKQEEGDSLPQWALREISILASLQHPNIVGFLAAKVEKKAVILYMECGETDIQHLLGRGAKLPFDVGDGIYQLLRGLGFLHSRNILHRDIKPHNILLKNGVLQLADFGLSIQKTSTHRSYNPDVVTLWWRCPHMLLKAHGNYGADLDIWSLGVVCVVLFQKEHAPTKACSKPPWTGGSERSMLIEIFKIIGTPHQDESKRDTPSYWPNILSNHRFVGRFPDFPTRCFCGLNPSQTKFVLRMLRYHNWCNTGELAQDPILANAAARAGGVLSTFITPSQPRPEQVLVGFRRGHLTETSRFILVEWLHEVVWNQCRETRNIFFLAVIYIDRFFSKTQEAITKDRYQLLGAAALLLASKYMAHTPWNAQEINEFTANAYTVQDVEAMEANIVSTLGFLLGSVSKMQNLCDMPEFYVLTTRQREIAVRCCESAYFFTTGPGHSQLVPTAIALAPRIESSIVMGKTTIKIDTDEEKTTYSMFLQVISCARMWKQWVGELGRTPPPLETPKTKKRKSSEMSIGSSSEATTPEDLICNETI